MLPSLSLSFLFVVNLKNSWHNGDLGIQSLAHLLTNNTICRQIMKTKKLGFTLTTAMLLMLYGTPSFAMDLKVSPLGTPADDNTITSSGESSPRPTPSPSSPIDLGAYPSKISFILGYSRVTVKNASISSLSVPEQQLIFNQELTSAPLDGIKIGVTQFITVHWGYELATNYFLSKKSNANYSGNYDDFSPPESTANANSSLTTKLWTVEALAVGGIHLSQNWLLLAKFGLGYEYLTQPNTISGTVVDNYNVNPPTTIPSSNSTYKAHSLGLAGGVGIRYSLTHNFSFEVGANDLAGKRNLLMYEATMLVRA